MTGDARWSELKNLMASTDYYRGTIDLGGQEALKYVFDVPGGRTQLVLLRRRPSSVEEFGGEWVIIETPFAELKQVDLTKVIAKTELFGIGGLGQLGEFVTLRNSIDLKAIGMGTNESGVGAAFIMEVIKQQRELANLSDALEGHFVGEDAL